MPEGKRTVKDHGQPEVGDWILNVSTGLMFTADNGGDWPDYTEWLPASAVVIPDHYAPPPSKFKVGDWVEWKEDGTVLVVIGVKWSPGFRCWQLWRSNGRWVSSDDATKVDPPFPSSLSAVGWREMRHLSDEHECPVWILHGDGSVDSFAKTFREHDVDTTLGVQRIAWQPIDAPPVPSDWSPA